MSASSASWSCASCHKSFSPRGGAACPVQVCPACGAVLHSVSAGLRVLAKSKSGAAAVPVLPLGSRGTLDGGTWEVAGYAARSDGSGEFTWSEYLLVNPRRGLRWLTENQGHWSLGEPVENKAPVGLPSGGVRHRGTTFRPFLKGHARVRGLAGGFPWPIKHGEVGVVADFISPPWMLSREGAREGTSWTLNRYVTGGEIRTAFAPADPLPPRSGVAPNQPFAGAGRERAAWWLTAGMILALFAIQGVAMLTTGRQEIARGVVGPTADPAAAPVVFNVPSGPCTLVVTARATGTLTRLDARMTLLHEAAGTRDVLSLSLRPGTAAGTLEDAKALSAMRAGAYRLTVEPPPGLPVEILVTAGVPGWRNFWITATIVVLLRLALSVWGWSFEASRWSQSELDAG